MHASAELSDREKFVRALSRDSAERAPWGENRESGAVMRRRQVRRLGYQAHHIPSLHFRIYLPVTRFGCGDIRRMARRLQRQNGGPSKSPVGQTGGCYRQSGRVPVSCRFSGRVWFATGWLGSMRSRTSAQLCGMLVWWAPRHGANHGRCPSNESSCRAAGSQPAPRRPGSRPSGSKSATAARRSRTGARLPTVAPRAD